MAKLKDVFVPGGMPSYTYQDRKTLNLEGLLLNSVHRLRKFIAVAGPTKSGKTVLVRKVIPPEESIWIEGAHIASIDDFWSAILAKLGVASPTSQSKTKSTEENTESELSSGFKPVGIGAETKAKHATKSSNSQTLVTGLQNSKSQSAVAALLNSGKTIVIDDFHYVSSENQTALIRGSNKRYLMGFPWC